MKRFNLLLIISLLSFFAMGMISSASAITITPDTYQQWTPPPDIANPKAADIPGIVGYSGTLYELYKQDQGDEPVDSGPWASAYNTTFDNTPSDPAEATISWEGNTGDPHISGDELYLLVKGGRGTDPSWYIFDLNVLNNGTLGYSGQSWDGMESIILEEFWVNDLSTPDINEGIGAISHVSIYGNRTSVPEPATLLLLGTGLIGLAGLGRRKFKK